MDMRYVTLRAAEAALLSKEPLPEMPVADRLYFGKVRKRILIDLDFMLSTFEATHER